MMTPRSPPTRSVLAIRSAPSRNTLKVPIRLMSTTLRNASSGKTPSLLSTRMALPVPAQLTTMRSVPIDSAVSSALAAAASSVTSACANRARSPSSATASSPLRSSTTTCAPASSSRLVVARPRPDAPPVTTATTSEASLISTECFPSFGQPTGWLGLYPVAEYLFDVAHRLRRARCVRPGPREPRGRHRLQTAIDLVKGVPLGDVRLGVCFAECQHRRDAGVGIGEHLCPVVAVVTGERFRQQGPQFGPAGDVVLRRQIGASQTQP